MVDPFLNEHGLGTWDRFGEDHFRSVALIEASRDAFILLRQTGIGKPVAPEQLFHDICRDEQAPADLLLRGIDSLRERHKRRTALKLVRRPMGWPLSIPNPG